MEQREKELLDIYERFGKDAQAAMDFVHRNIEAGREPVEFDMTKLQRWSWSRRNMRSAKKYIDARLEVEDGEFRQLKTTRQYLRTLAKKWNE